MIAAIVYLFTGCKSGMSEKEKDFIEARIKYHNAMVASAVRPASDFADTFVLMKPQLTYSEFMQYCEKRNLDPVKTADKLSEK